MNRKIRKNSIVAAVVALILVLFCLVALNRDMEEAIGQALLSDDGLIISNIDVGHGDAAIVQCEGQVGIIDTGLSSQYETLSMELNRRGITGIKILLLTHYDKDHIGGATQLIEDYNVDTVVIPDYISDKKKYSKLMDALADMPDVRLVNEATSLELGGGRIDVYPSAMKTTFEENSDNLDNNMSLVSMLSYKEKKFLFAGDIEQDRIKEILDSETDLKCDWLKVPHHGKASAGNKLFFEATNPEIAVVSCSSDEGVDSETVKELDSCGAQVYSTMESSIITIYKGKDIKVLADK